MLTDRDCHVIVERFRAFIQKVRARLNEIVVESEAAVSELIQIEVVDIGPLSAAMTAVQARIDGLVSKVDEACEKAERQLEAIANADHDPAQREAAGVQLLQMREALRTSFAIESERFSVRMSANAASRLDQLSRAEAERRLACDSCGGPLGGRRLLRATNLTCPRCGSVTTVQLGPATRAFSGVGVDALARVATFDLWILMHVSENRYRSLRRHSEQEFQSWADATTTYWSRFFQEKAKYFPELDSREIQAHVDAKLGRLNRDGRMAT